MKVNLPDGTIANFPEGTSREDMTRAIQSYLMKSAVDIGEQQAVAGAEQRAKEPAETFYGGRGDMGELVTPEFAETQALVGATIPAVVGTGMSFAAAPLATGASIIAGHEGSKIGGSVAKTVGAPPWAGQLVGGLAGGLSPSLVTRRTIPALLAQMAQGGAKEVAKDVATPAIAQAESQIAKALVASGHPAERAAEVARAEIARITAAPAEAAAATVPRATLPIQPTYRNPEDALLAKFKMLIESSGGNKEAIKEQVRKYYPQSWQEVWKMLNQPRTRI